MFSNHCLICIYVCIMLSGQTIEYTPNPSACEIFCRGKILDVVQRSGLYEDSKEFVDMKMKLPPKQIHDFFNQMMKSEKGKPTKIQVKRFVRHCFASSDKEFERKAPTDWVEKPKMLKEIKDRQLREWAMDLVLLWKRLGRIVSPVVHKHPDMYSLVYVPHLIIIPGGRHKEYYYWDSYWIILGLLRSEMFLTVQGMILNYLLLIKLYGFVPNGGRIYYLTRSNLPLLLPMVNEYYDVTKNLTFVHQHIDTLEAEFSFWMKHRVIDIHVNGKTYKFGKYDSESKDPRPDAYINDLEWAKDLKTEAEKHEFYRNLITACESGWDFSSRWFLKDDLKTGNMTDIKPRSILPVDLNAVLCWNARILSEFYKLLNINDKSEKYKHISSDFQKSLTEVMWDDEDGIWYDYDLEHHKTRKNFFVSNIVPLWTMSYDLEKKDLIGSKVTEYLKSYKIETYHGGIPSSLITTKLHWDFPNAIPPMQHVIIKGLYMTENKDAVDLAYILAENWIHTTFQGYLFTKAMFDKYNAEKPGLSGTDQFELAQVGFGWTNGVCLELLNIYGKLLVYVKSNAPRSYIQPSIVFQITFVTLIIFVEQTRNFCQLMIFVYE